MKWNSCRKWIWETPDLALLELRAFPSFWPPIGPKILQKAGKTHFEIIKMQISPKTKGFFFATNGDFLDKRLTLSNKNYIYILRKTQIPNFEF